MSYREDLTRVVRRVVEPAARDVDEQARFPREALNALGAAGLLGLTVPARYGGGGKGLGEAVQVVEEIGRVCGSTAAVVQAHFAATAVLVEHGPEDVVREIADGRHLSTLALTDVGERHVAQPAGLAEAHGGVIDLRARKTWVTAAGEADSYLWSSEAIGPRGAATLWMVSAQAPGLCIPAEPEGVGLRGSATATVTADPVHLPSSAMVGADGAGTDIVLNTALPWLLVLDAAAALGLMDSVLRKSLECVNGPQPSWSRWQQPPGRRPEVRADLARMQAKADAVRLLLRDAEQAVLWQRSDADLRVLQVKAVAGEAAVHVAELGMKVCGHFAFRKDLGLERRFRDAHTAVYGQLTTEAALDSLGRATCGIPLLARELP